MTKISNRSVNRKTKYGLHFAITVKNKIRRMNKHLLKHPNDNQTKKDSKL